MDRALMRVFTAALLAANFFFPSAIAEPVLAPGEPAGIKQAESENSDAILMSGVAVVSADAAIALIGQKSDAAPISTSTATSP